MRIANNRGWCERKNEIRLLSCSQLEWIFLRHFLAIIVRCTCSSLTFSHDRCPELRFHIYPVRNYSLLSITIRWWVTFNITPFKDIHLTLEFGEKSWSAQAVVPNGILPFRDDDYGEHQSDWTYSCRIFLPTSQVRRGYGGEFPFFHHKSNEKQVESSCVRLRGACKIN